MYNTLLESSREFSFGEIEAYFSNTMRECPLVTVTREEDRLLNNDLLPTERYLQAGIEIGEVEEMTFGTTPEWTPLGAQVEVVPDEPDEGGSPAGGAIADRRDHMSWGPGDIEIHD
ncbi:hypothetical protein A9K71_23555 [Mesorhizobium sp. WSM3873]|nr:hypothetical protein A9K71_23555 [Mesorhizobium sp. WSM3873]